MARLVILMLVLGGFAMSFAGCAQTRRIFGNDPNGSMRDYNSRTATEVD